MKGKANTYGLGPCCVDSFLINCYPVAKEFEGTWSEEFPHCDFGNRENTAQSDN